MSANARATRARRGRLDLGALLVVPVGVGVVLLSQLLEGGAARSLLQGAAALIVFGGTLGAILISYSATEVARAIRAAARTFVEHPDDTTVLTARMVALSMRAYRKGPLALESELDVIDDPFLRNGLSLVVDDTPLEALREILTVEKRTREADDEAPARVFEAAAGYAPTLGILGAVLGLIHVMENLSAPGALGSGIAVAFVATVYGVGSANLLFLPIAGRLRERAAATARRRDLIAEGLLALRQRMNPRLVAHRLGAFAGDVPATEDVASRLAKPGTTVRIPA